MTQYISNEMKKEVWNFLCAHKKVRVKWFTNEYITVYLRNSNRRTMKYGNLVVMPHIDVANVEVTDTMRHVGVWTEFRETVEAMADELNRPIYVENVLNRHLRESLIRHGYVESNEYTAEVLCFCRSPIHKEGET